MKQNNKLRTRLLGLSNTVYRFPLTAVILLIAAVFNAIRINSRDRNEYMKFLVALAVGAALFVVLQITYERFIHRPLFRYLFMAVTIAAMSGYYIILYFDSWDIKSQIRSTVILFILFIFFLWLPAFQSKLCFNKSFMAAFQAFFITIFFCGVLYLGVCLILAAINTLIFRIDSRTYLHAANIVFVFFAPLYYLSFIPVYEEQEEKEQEVVPGKIEEALDVLEGIKPEIHNTQENEPYIFDWKRAYTPSKFLTNLISFVLIPVIAVFTVILLLYIIINIAGSFWTDNLLEPMLMSYSIGGIIIYLLSSRLENKAAFYFRLIFPKILVVVVLFQTISSILITGKIGITYGRYYVLLFAIFAIIAGILFSFVSVEKNGFIAPVLILLSIISIIPPADAFSVSRISQIGRIESALRRNHMLEDHVISPRENISDEDKSMIRSSYRYLETNHELGQISWLSAYGQPYQFEEIFGFPEFDYGDKNIDNRYYYTRQGMPININDYDVMIHAGIQNGSYGSVIGSFQNNGKEYTINYDITEKIPGEIIVYEDSALVLLHFDVMEIFHKYNGLSADLSEITYDEAAFTKENNLMKLTYVADTINLNRWEQTEEYMSDGYFLIQLK